MQDDSKAFKTNESRYSALKWIGKWNLLDYFKNDKNLSELQISNNADYLFGV